MFRKIVLTLLLVSFLSVDLAAAENNKPDTGSSSLGSCVTQKQEQKKLDGELFDAIANGDFVLIASLIDQGANVNAHEVFQRATPLHIAAANGYLDIVKYLIKKDAKIDETDDEGGTVLQAAVIYDNLEIVKYLVENGAEADIDETDNDEKTSLHWAAEGDNLEVVKYLVENGADPAAVDDDGETPVEKATNPEIKKYLEACSTFKTGTPLEVAEYVEKKLSVTDPKVAKNNFKFLCEIVLSKKDAPGRLYWIITDKFNKFNREQFGFTFKTPKEFYLHMLELYKQAPSKVLLDFCRELFRVCVSPLTFGEISDNGNLPFDKQLTNKFEELFVPKEKDDNENKNNLGDKNKKSAENLDLSEKYGKIRELYNKNYRFSAQLLTVLNNNKKFVDLKVTFKN